MSVSNLFAFVNEFISKDAIHRSSTIPGALVLTSLSCASLLWLYSSSKKERKLKRSVSFTSMGLALGSFPEVKQVPDAVINSACYFENEPPSTKDICLQIVAPLLKYKRLSHILDVKSGDFAPAPTAVKEIDLVREICVDGDENLTNRTIFDHTQDELKSGSSPWWEILVVRNRGIGRSACVIRLHHALGDGLSLVSVFLRILTKQDGSPMEPHSTSMQRPMGRKGWVKTAFDLVAATIHVLTLGSGKYDDATLFSKSANATLAHNGKREFVVFPVVPLEFIKRLKTAAGVTVNDVLVCAVSQAIHEYCARRDDSVLFEKGSKLQCRALLPVGFSRTQAELSNSDTALSNKWCMASCDIGVGCSDVKERLIAIKKATNEMKTKPRAFMQLKVQNAIAPLLPLPLSRQTCFDVFSRHSLVLTNVPGPLEPCVFAGKLISGVQLFFSNILPQVDILSYAGNVYGNLIYDPIALPDISKDFGQAFTRALLRLANMHHVDPPSHLMHLQTVDGPR